jgi:hypothetical protein
MFEKLEESSQHLKPLYVRSHIDGKPISKMLIDSGAVVNLMPYSIFKKLGREDNELVKTNLTLNGVGGNLMEARGDWQHGNDMCEVIEDFDEVSVSRCTTSTSSSIHYIKNWCKVEGMQ